MNCYTRIMSENQRHPMTNAPDLSWLFFRFSGRIGRQSFILATVFNFLLMVLVVYQLVRAEEDEALLTFWGFAFIFLTFGLFWSALALAVKRLNDIGLPAAFVILYFIPPVNWLFFLFLIAKPGDPETNPHGPPPFSSPEQS